MTEEMSQLCNDFSVIFADPSIIDLQLFFNNDKDVEEKDSLVLRCLYLMLVLLLFLSALSESEEPDPSETEVSVSDAFCVFP